MNAETKLTWFQAGAVFGMMLTTLLFYIYFTTPKKADSKPVIHIVDKKEATKPTPTKAKAS